MKKNYVSPNIDLVSICANDIMNGSAENMINLCSDGLGDEYFYSEYFK